MADALEILTSAVHANVPATLAGQTYMLPLVGGAIPRAAQAKGAAVDTTDYTTLRGLTLMVTHMDAVPTGGMPTPREDEQGRHDSASLYALVETGPTAAGPWTLLHEFTPMNSRAVQRVPFAVQPDNFVRASWWYCRYGGAHDATVRQDVKFTFAITADALPEA